MKKKNERKEIMTTLVAVRVWCIKKRTTSNNKSIDDIYLRPSN